MAIHPLDREVASDLSYQVFQKRYSRRELATPQLDNAHRRLYSMVGSGYNPRLFIADVEEGTDAACANPPTQATVGFHPKEGR